MTAGIVRSSWCYREIETSFRTAGRGENSLAGVYDGHYKGWVQKEDIKKEQLYNFVPSHVLAIHV